MTTTRTNKISNEELWRLETQEGWSFTRIVRELHLSDAVVRRYEKYRDKKRRAAARQRMAEYRREIEAEVDLEREMYAISSDRDNQGGTWGR